MPTVTRRVQRMPGEVEIDEAVSGSWLRIIGRFEYTPKATFQMERVASGTCYHAETPTKVREVLETYMGQGVRLSLNYGNVVTGEDWLDEYDMEGYVSRTTGPCTSPILCHNSRSSGGFTILDAVIIRIKLAKRTRDGDRTDLYRHPLYHADEEKHRRNIPNAAEQQRVWERRFA